RRQLDLVGAVGDDVVRDAAGQAGDVGPAAVVVHHGRARRPRRALGRRQLDALLGRVEGDVGAARGGRVQLVPGARARIRQVDRRAGLRVGQARGELDLPIARVDDVVLGGAVVGVQGAAVDADAGAAAVVIR